MASGLAQFIFEFLFDSLEELNVISAGEQPAQEQRLVKVDFLSVSPSNLAYKQVREGWAWDLALSLPQGVFLISKQPLPKEAGGLSPRARHPKVTNQTSDSRKCRHSLPEESLEGASLSPISKQLTPQHGFNLR